MSIVIKPQNYVPMKLNDFTVVEPYLLAKYIQGAIA